ncbi:MAG: hypothetical protein NVS2B4_19990 [Ramlibacter sp.]
MGRSGVQQHQVDQVADALLQEGRRPTIERVRERLGTGSPNTLGPMLESWFKRLGPRVAGVAQGSGPIAQLPLAVQNAFRLFWDQATADAGERAMQMVQTRLQELQAARGAVAQEAAALAASRQALEDSAHLAQRQLEDMRVQLAALQAQLTTSQDAVTTGQHELASTRAQLAALRQRQDEMAQHHAAERAQDAERASANQRRHLQEIDRARQETAHERATAATAAGQHARELALLREQVDQANAVLAQTQQQMRDARAQTEALERTAQAATSQAEQTLRACSLLESNLAAERRSSEALAKAMQAAEQRAASVDQALQETRSLIAELRAKAADLPESTGRRRKGALPRV